MTMQNFENQRNRSIVIWLGLMCIAIVTMIFIGGLTRLTESGLSITEWNPISGVIPPLTEADWQIEFDKYKKSPEYLKHNLGMNVSEFKDIYLLEFIHRIAGRITGLLYILPLMFFFIRGYIKKPESYIYILATALLGMQGFMGWYMVKSGLVSDPHVSHYRLAAHLMFAVFLYIIMFWQMMRHCVSRRVTSSNINIRPIYNWCLLSIVLLLVQMMLGAFVAGLDAGLLYNDFPMMGDRFVPYELLSNSLSFASLEDTVFIQFIHRIMAYILVLVVGIFSWKSISFGDRNLTISTWFVLAAVILQMCLGIMTLLYQVPIILAILHQLGAVLLLSCLLRAFFLIKSFVDYKKYE
ncbi:MAG: COX15/CtaA family protein [Rickettsiaceae bacterium]|nr:COX15/CtaA family protein [Rickettsiaceae bacterium]